MSRSALVAALVAFALAPGAQGGVALLPADLLTAPAPHDEVPVPWDLDGPSAHVVLHALVRDPGTGAPTTVFALEDASGALALYLVAASGALHATDGYEADGATPRPLLRVGGAIGETWLRLDVRVDGATYLLRLDETHVVVGRTFAAASEVRARDPATLPHGPAHDATRVEVANLRFVPADAASTSFRAPIAAAGWATHATSGAVETQADAEGFLSGGRLAVAAQLGPTPAGGAHAVMPGVAYAHRPIPAHTGSYLVQAWARPHAASALQPGGVPDHQALAAGLAGPLDAPQVRWALVLAHADSSHDRWAYHLVGPDGSRTQVSPAWTSLDPLWRGATLRVDEGAGEIVLHVEGASTALRFAFGELGASERLALGDVWLDHPLWTGAGTAYYDEVALVVA